MGHAFVTSRVDYCKSLLHRVSDYKCQMLEYIIISPPNSQNCISYLLTTYKYVERMAPEYLYEISPLESHPGNTCHPVK